MFYDCLFWHVHLFKVFIDELKRNFRLLYKISYGHKQRNVLTFSPTGDLCVNLKEFGVQWFMPDLSTLRGLYHLSLWSETNNISSVHMILLHFLIAKVIDKKTLWTQFWSNVNLKDRQTLPPGVWQTIVASRARERAVRTLETVDKMDAFDCNVFLWLFCNDLTRPDNAYEYVP